MVNQSYRQGLRLGSIRALALLVVLLGIEEAEADTKMPIYLPRTALARRWRRQYSTYGLDADCRFYIVIAGTRPALRGVRQLTAPILSAAIIADTLTRPSRMALHHVMTRQVATFI